LLAATTTLCFSLDERLMGCEGMSVRPLHRAIDVGSFVPVEREAVAADTASVGAGWQGI